MLMEARARTSDWRYAHIGELLFNIFMVLIHLDPQEHIRLWYTVEGELVGFAMLGEDPNFDFQVYLDTNGSASRTRLMPGWSSAW